LLLFFGKLPRFQEFWAKYLVTGILDLWLNFVKSLIFVDFLKLEIVEILHGAKVGLFIDELIVLGWTLLLTFPLLLYRSLFYLTCMVSSGFDLCGRTSFFIDNFNGFVIRVGF
jgi:hypothetical protein